MTNSQPSKIVVGVDFSPASEEAAQQALAICRRGGHDLVLVHAGAVVEVPPPSPSASPAVRQAAEAWRAQLMGALDQVRERLAALRERLSDQGVTVSQVVVEESPAAGVCAVASEVRARLTVVGAHGGGGLPWLSLGSAATGVVRISETDVLVARPARDGRRELRRVVVGTDFSASAERALDSALELAAPDAHIDVVHCAAMRPVVYSGFGTMEAFPVELRQILIEDIRMQGEQLIARKRKGGRELAFHVSSDHPAAGLAHWAESRSCDLVAVGSHGRRGIRRLLLGSVAESMLRRAPCSVLVAHGLPQGAGG